MLKIRTEQMHVLREHRLRAFEDSVAARLGGDEAAARIWVRESIPTFMELGFRTEADLSRLLIAVHANRSVDWETLRDAELTVATRLALIEEQAARR